MINSGLVMIQRPRSSNITGVATFMRTGGFYLGQIAKGDSGFVWTDNIKGYFDIDPTNGKTALDANNITADSVTATNINGTNLSV
jgi:hypothetical protein